MAAASPWSSVALLCASTVPPAMVMEPDLRLSPLGVPMPAPEPPPMATSFASTVALVIVRDAVSGTKRPAAEERVATSRLPGPLSRTVAATPFPRAKGASARSETPLRDVDAVHGEVVVPRDDGRLALRADADRPLGAVDGVRGDVEALGQPEVERAVVVREELGRVVVFRQAMERADRLAGREAGDVRAPEGGAVCVLGPGVIGLDPCHGAAEDGERFLAPEHERSARDGETRALFEEPRPVGGRDDVAADAADDGAHVRRNRESLLGPDAGVREDDLV